MYEVLLARRASLAALVFVAALFLIAFRTAMVALVSYWISNDVYFYAFLIPLISVLIVWTRREEFLDLPIRPSLVLGGVATAAGIAVLVFGQASNTNLIEEISVVITVAALTVLLAGRTVFRRFWFPVVYLLAMVPFWDVLTSRLHPFFQLFSAAIGVRLLQAFGIPVLRDGFLIVLPKVTLQVAEACSGVNYLIAILCIGVPATLLFVSHWAKRLFILAVSVGIAIAGNAVRVTIVSLFAYYDLRGPNGDIHGPFALFRSLAIAGVGYMALFSLILYYADKELPRSRRRLTEIVDRISALSATGSRAWSFLLAVVLLLSCTAFQAWYHTTAVPLARDLATFPTTLGRWHLHDSALTAPDSERAMFDETLSRDYEAADGERISLLFGYLREQTPERKLAGYSMLGLLDRGDSPAETVRYSRSFRAKDFVVREGPAVYHVTYWYILGGETVSEDYQVRLLSGVRSLWDRASNGSVVILRKRLGARETLSESRIAVFDFAHGFMKAIDHYLPGREGTARQALETGGSRVPTSSTVRSR